MTTYADRATMHPLCALVVLFGLLVPDAAFAQAAKSYVWAEADGTVHTSARLEDVAEPFLSIYRDQQAAGAQGSLAGAGAATGLEDTRAQWRGKLRAARAALLGATLKWATLSQKDASLQMNPILRLTPMVQAERQQGAKALEEAKANYLVAYKNLTVKLPEEARRNQIPAMWLQ